MSFLLWMDISAPFVSFRRPVLAIPTVQLPEEPKPTLLHVCGSVLCLSTAPCTEHHFPSLSQSISASLSPFTSSSSLLSSRLSPLSPSRSPLPAPGLLLRLRLRPRFGPPLLPWPAFPGGGRTNAKSTLTVWSRSFLPFIPSMAARASSRVVYSINA